MPTTTIKVNKITSLTQLLGIIQDGQDHEFFIALAGGLVRSTKTISLKPRANRPPKLRVFNHVDDTTQLLTLDDLNDPDKTNIGIAIRHGAFYEVTG